MCESRSRSEFCKSSEKTAKAARKRYKEKKLQLKVLFLDDTEQTFEVEQGILGSDFYNKVCGYLKLLEKEYFGLEFRNHTGSYVWLELLKPIAKQVKNANEISFKFIVKFFPPDPGQLQKELTRYLFALQIRQDLANGGLPCNDNSAALLVSHILQSEMGDFDEELDIQQLECKQYLPNQEYLDNKIMRFHQKHRGQLPAESDVQLLEIARKLDMYGIRPHPANDGEGMKINLAAAHMGVLVFQGNTKINTFNWAKIRKVSFKRKHFLIKLHSKIVPSCKDTVEFTMVSRDACKAFWKMCVEYHAFFRLSEEPQSRHKSLLCSKGSYFRYSGRTQKQLLECVGRGEKRNLPFERKHCKAHYDTRQCRSSPDLLTDVSTQAHEQTHSDDTDKHSEQAPPAALAGKRSKSAVEVIFAAELERSKPEADPASFNHSRSSSFSCFEAEGRPDVLQGQRSCMYFVRSNSIAEVDRSRMITNPQLLRHTASPNYALSAKQTDGFVSSASFYLECPPPLPMHASLLEDVIRSSSFSNPSSMSPASRGLQKNRCDGLYQVEVTSCGSRINVGREEAGHRAENPNYQVALPKRSWSQCDMKFLHTAHSTEFRSLAHYHYPSRKPSLVRQVLPQHVGADRRNSVCTTERYVGSGTDGSDSDSDIIYPYYYPVLGKLVKAAPLARLRVSSGSLQLDEEDEDSFNNGDCASASPLTASTKLLS
ncbi:FERM domain-containing protein 7-like [Polyodon spathula]|uniref:FERM domain-containing protein 7-like n=1 Tax=Polyodon spathula TaxID=7913 RepID=UPI001B7E275C|nr:FERM domain-containing protein 7-like [Polyodon spathula]